jgi:hypothetical protein
VANRDLRWGGSRNRGGGSRTTTHHGKAASRSRGEAAAMGGDDAWWGVGLRESERKTSERRGKRVRDLVDGGEHRKGSEGPNRFRGEEADARGGRRQIHDESTNKFLSPLCTFRSTYTRIIPVRCYGRNKFHRASNIM